MPPANLIKYPIVLVAAVVIVIDFVGTGSITTTRTRRTTTKA
jgi:hypothetical protein